MIALSMPIGLKVSSPVINILLLILLNALFRNINTACSSKRLLDITINGELTSCQSSATHVSFEKKEADGPDLPNHEQTSTDTSIATAEAKLLGNLDQTASSALSRQTFGLVNLAQHGISRLRYNGCGKTGNKTRAKIDGGL